MHCLFSLFYCYLQDPCEWDDVLKKNRIVGECKAAGCSGDSAVCIGVVLLAEIVNQLIFVGRNNI